VHPGAEASDTLAGASPSGVGEVKDDAGDEEP